MKSVPLSGGFIVAVLAAAALAGCAGNTQFVYKPGAPPAAGERLPVKVAVLPFKDGTDAFTRQGSVFEPDSLRINLVKTGVGHSIDPLIPEIWAKAFAEEAAASGEFRAVRFVYSPQELLDEEYHVDGVVEKAYAAGGWKTPSEYTLAFRAVRRADNKTVWERKVARSVIAQKSAFEGCGGSVRCMRERSHAELNKVMRDMFAEAGADLAVTIAALSGARGVEGGPGGRASTGEDTREKSPGLPAPGSVEQAIERILQGK